MPFDCACQENLKKKKKKFLLITMTTIESIISLKASKIIGTVQFVAMHSLVVKAVSCVKRCN